jgi:hypothetical protein
MEEQDQNVPTSEPINYEVIPLPEEEPRDPSKTGPKPKQLKAMEVYGYEVGRGNRKRIVTPDDVYKLAAIGCTDSEIAVWFDVPRQTLVDNFRETLAKGREDIKMALRQAMIKNALGGNAVMQIWLSKNWLNMSDNPVNSEANAPLPWSDDE